MLLELPFCRPQTSREAILKHVNTCHGFPLRHVPKLGKDIVLCWWFLQDDAVKQVLYPNFHYSLLTLQWTGQFCRFTYNFHFLNQYYHVFLLCLDKPYIHAHNIHVYQCSLEKQNQKAQPSSTIHTWLPWLELTGRGREGEEGRTVREEQFDLELAAVSLESSLI